MLITGIYTGVQPTGVQLQLLDQADQTGATVIQDWASLSGFIVNTAAKTFSGYLTAPVQKKWLSFKARKLNTQTQIQKQSQVKFGVGEVFVMQGDSITGLMASFTSQVTPNGFVSRWGKFSNNAWGTIMSSAEMGAGEAAFANKVSNDLNCCVGIVSISTGGSPVSNFTTTANAIAVHAALDVLTLCDSSQVAARAGWYLWDQGPADASVSGYGAKLDSLYSWLRTNLGSDILFGESFQSNRQPNTVDSTPGIDGLRHQQMDWMAGKASDPLVVPMNDDHYFWSNTGDGAHPGDPTDMTLKGEMMGLTVSKFRGVSPYDGFGPKPVSVARTGAVIDVTFQHNGGTALQTWQAGDVTGFDVVKASTGFVPDFITNGVSVNTATDTITVSGRTFANDDKVMVAATTTMPGGLSAGTLYYAVNASGSACQLSATKGGSVIDITSAGSGLYVTRINSLLDISSAVILNSNTVRITLASDPGEPVQVHYLWGLPGRKNADPDVTIDATGRSAMSQKTAQSNIVFDNYPLATASTHLPGRPSRTTSNQPLQSST
jgi:hypothetical protein